YFNTQYLLAQLPTLPPQYMLTINESGNGSVTLNPNLTLVDSGTTLQLTATPSSGYSFSSWTGDASGSSNPLSVVMNGNKTITATFIQNTFTITATAGLNGSISPNGTVNVNYGVNQIFTITSNTSYHIDSVFIDNNYVGNSSLDTVKNVTASHTISVTFAINQYTITSSAGSNGTISPLGNVGVNYGGTQAFTITP